LAFTGINISTLIYNRYNGYTETKLKNIRNDRTIKVRGGLASGSALVSINEATLRWARLVAYWDG